MEQDSPVPASTAFILNMIERIAHKTFVENGRSFTLEECNVDSIAYKTRSDVIPEGYDLCDHCIGPKSPAVKA